MFDTRNISAIHCDLMVPLPSPVINGSDPLASGDGLKVCKFSNKGSIMKIKVTLMYAAWRSICSPAITMINFAMSFPFVVRVPWHLSISTPFFSPSLCQRRGSLRRRMKSSFAFVSEVAPLWCLALLIFILPFLPTCAVAPYFTSVYWYPHPSLFLLVMFLLPDFLVCTHSS